MGLQPGILTNPGDLGGVYSRLGDLERRVSTTEVARGIVRAIDGSIINPGSITTPALAAGSITAELIQSNAIETRHLQADAIKAGKIAADAITAREIAALSITAGHVQANAITAVKLDVGSVTAEKIVANAITTDKLFAGAVTAEKISVGSLSAITSIMGNITSGTITGGTIRSGTSGSRWEGDPAGLRGYAMDGVTKTFEINTGSGIASFVGIATLDANSVVPTGTLSGFLSGGNIVPNSSFEQGVNTDTGLDRWVEGWQVMNATATKNTTLNVHGQNSVTLTASAAGNSAIGRRDIVADRLRILPNRRYYVSAYTRAATTARNVKIWVDWYDASNAQIGYTGSVEVLNSTTEFTRISFKTPVAPAAAVAMGFNVEFQGVAAGEVHYVDALQVEHGDVLTAYQPLATEILYSSIRSVFIGAGQIKANNIEAGAVKAQHITVAFGGNNRAPNFSAEAPISGTWGGSELTGYWFNTGGTATRVTTDAYDGAACVEVSASGSLNYQGGTNYHSDMAYKAGVKYTASIWAKSVSGATGVEFFAGLASPNSARTTGTLTTSWQRFTWIWTPTADVPTGTTVYVGMRTYLGAAAAVFRIDAAQLEEGELATPAGRRPGEVLAGEIGPTQITPNSITADRMMTGTITAASGIIADAAITNAKIVSVDAAKITTGFLDAARIQANTITAGKLKITVGGNNLVTHSSFENTADPLTTWNVWNSAPSTTTSVVKHGTRAVAMTGVQGLYRDIYGLVPTKAYTVSMWVRTTAGATIIPEIYIHDVVGANVVIVSPVAADANDKWTRLELPFTATSTGGVRVHLRGDNTWSSTRTGTAYWDALQVEEGEIATAYSPKADELLPGVVGTTTIADGAITTDKITTNVITGKNFQTSTAHPKVAFDLTGFFKTDSAGDKAINLGTGSGEGLQLLAKNGNGLQPLADVYTVNWKNSAGDIMANIWGTTGVGDADRGGLFLTARNKVLGGMADTFIGAYGYNTVNGSTNRADMTFASSGTATNRGIYCTADSGEGSLYLIRGDGYSDWARTSYELADRPDAGSGSGASPTFAFTTEVTTSTGALIRPTITTKRNLIVRVMFQTIVMLQDAAWYRIDGYVSRISGTERNGVIDSPYTIHVSHNALGWQTIRAEQTYFIQKNEATTFRFLLQPVQGTWQYYYSNSYTRGHLAVVGYW